VIHDLIKDRYPYAICMVIARGDECVLMRFRTLREAEENLRLYENNNPDKAKLRVAHNAEDTQNGGKD
jgi:hypothetical protein